MTGFWDKSRPRLLTGRPCWADAPMTALPYMMLDPMADGSWLAGVMIGGQNAASWAQVQLAASEVPRLLVNWQADPERTCREIFKREPPAGNSVEAVVIVTNRSLEDLDL